jgi:hypothetical protein
MPMLIPLSDRQSPLCVNVAFSYRCYSNAEKLSELKRVDIVDSFSLVFFYSSFKYNKLKTLLSFS